MDEVLKFKDTLPLEIKDVDLTKRTVSGYFSTFGVKDSDGDVIVQGAYKKTIAENSSRIAHLRQHRIDQPIGKLLSLQEDSLGLAFTSQMSKSTLGNDTLILYQEGILKEHSVGIQVLKGNPMTDYYEIQEVKMWEGSTVTFGANELTPVTGIKSKSEQLQHAVSKLAQLEAYLKKGTVSDESFRLIEFEVLRLKSILSLEIEEPQSTHSKKNEPTFDFDKFKTLLIS